MRTFAWFLAPMRKHCLLVIPTLGGQRQEDPWELLVSQSSLISDAGVQWGILSPSIRWTASEEGAWPQPLTSSYIISHMNMHTYMHRYKNFCASENTIGNRKTVHQVSNVCKLYITKGLSPTYVKTLKILDTICTNGDSGSSIIFKSAKRSKVWKFENSLQTLPTCCSLEPT